MAEIKPDTTITLTADDIKEIEQMLMSYWRYTQLEQYNRTEKSRELNKAFFMGMQALWYRVADHDTYTNFALLMAKEREKIENQKDMYVTIQPVNGWTKYYPYAIWGIKELRYPKNQYGLVYIETVTGRGYKTKEGALRAIKRKGYTYVETKQISSFTFEKV